MSREVKGFSQDCEEGIVEGKPIGLGYSQKLLCQHQFLPATKTRSKPQREVTGHVLGHSEWHRGRITIAVGSMGTRAARRNRQKLS